MTARITASTLSARLSAKNSNLKLIDFQWPLGTVYCEKHHVGFTRRFTALLHHGRHVCPKCSKEATQEFANSRKWFISRSDFDKLCQHLQVCRLTKFSVNDTMKFECMVCKENFLSTTRRISLFKPKSKRKGCPKCRRRNKPKYFTHDDYLQVLRDYHGSSITPLFTYKDKTFKRGVKKWFKCDKGHKFKTRVYLPANGSGCPQCTRDKICLGRGAITIQKQGKSFQLDSQAEVRVLNRLVKQFGIDQVQRKLPPIMFEYKGALKRYTPDFYVKSRKTYIEVKSIATLGLTSFRGSSPEKLFSETALKFFHLQQNLGRKIRLIVVGREGCLLIPNDWFLKPRDQVADFLRKRGHYLPPSSPVTPSNHKYLHQTQSWFSP